MEDSRTTGYSFGVVAIGRNEGERLRKCLESVIGKTVLVVYVDSGSTDGSIELARGTGADVLALDMHLPFTAGRARNAGLQRLCALGPEITYVQFVDGDCEIVSGWLESAADFLNHHRDVAVVCGRRRERYPERSIYNLLCDMEWDTPTGETKACGGDAMIRTEALLAVGGYRDNLIAGEEPELCIRLRGAGWRIWRLDKEMTLHDAAMTRFSQWCKRAMRFGHAMAEGVSLHGAPPERHWVRESKSAWLWGFGIPLFGSICVAVAGSFGLLVFTLYPLQVARLALKGNRSPRENFWHAFFLVISKFPEMAGQLRFLIRRHFGRQMSLIEYK